MKSEIIKERQESVEAYLLTNDDTDLPIEVMETEGKGRGVVTKQDIKKNDLIVEYAGELLSLREALERETQYTNNSETGSFMYFFRFNETKFCVDATEESGRLGRLINHSRVSPNCVTKVVKFHGKPRLVLVAKCDIEKGVELLFDYGERRKSAVTALPWLAR